jgi:3-hydroxyanthranilate 3,4-dioxygenase
MIKASTTSNSRSDFPALLLCKLSKKTVGLVIERQRLPGQLDTLRWYCDNPACRAIVYEETFQLEDLDLGKALTVVINKFYGDAELRTCKKCGHVCTPPTGRAQPTAM